MPIQTELSQEQKLLGIRALRSLLERVGEFVWSWQRPDDYLRVQLLSGGNDEQNALVAAHEARNYERLSGGLPPRRITMAELFNPETASLEELRSRCEQGEVEPLTPAPVPPAPAAEPPELVTYRRRVENPDGTETVFEADSMSELVDLLVEAQRNSTISDKEDECAGAEAEYEFGAGRVSNRVRIPVRP